MAWVCRQYSKDVAPLRLEALRKRRTACCGRMNSPDC
jgi:hypothetical protein